MRAPANGIELEYETFGDPEDPPLLLVMGLGAQMIWIHPDFCQDLVDRGFYVIRFDNRDVGLSTKIDVDIDPSATVMALLQGEHVEVPYRISDMADDAWGLCDHLGLDRVHLFGVSLGGMIVQQMAIDRPERVGSLTSLMSTTGDPDVGQPSPEGLASLIEPSPTERAAYIANAVETATLDPGDRVRRPRVGGRAQCARLRPLLLSGGDRAAVRRRRRVAVAVCRAAGARRAGARDPRRGRSRHRDQRR